MGLRPESSGNPTSVPRDWNQSPLASPFSAETHVSRVIGPESGAASEVDSIRPKKVAARTFPSFPCRS
jgi:hypothetical protein